jgi:phosphopantetheinyl transferase (holo-ACP synthase)
MTDATNVMQDRLDKVQKLLNKAERSSTEEEASAFFAKAEDLMTRWAIDDAMLRAAGKLDKENIEQRQVKVPSTYFSADMILASRIGRVHNVKLLQNKPMRYIVLIGFTSDIEHVVQLYTLLRIQAVRFAQKGLDEHESKAWMTGMEQYVWRRSFREGFAERVGDRLREQVRSTTTEAKKTHGSGMELVLVDKKKQVDDYYDGISKGKARARRERYSNAGGAAGRAAGNSADLGNSRLGNKKALGS